MEQMNFSACAHDRTLKVARTLTDLAGSDNMLDAIEFSSLNRKLFS